jgi:isoleucyl-tRNA synthetase
MKKSSFPQLEPVPDLPNQEKDIIEYWKEIDVVNELKRMRKGEEEKVYYDGPITANNLPHYGHAIQWTLKDLVPRYWSMKGFYVSRNMGWDCQGIPVEYEIEKELGFESKEDIEKYGVKKFNELCKNSVFKYRDEIFRYETRIGRWFDEEDMYYTMDKDFIESMWWSLKELHKKGLLYEGHKVVAYSTRAGTTLSTHEVNAGGYKEIEDPYVTVKFEITDDSDLKGSFLLAWTTTPWTIPGNLLLAVGEAVEYSKVESGEETFILATDRIKEIFKGNKYEVLGKVEVKDLIGLSYKQPFDYFESKRNDGLFEVVSSSHATTEEGTGVVHLAPYGAEDFEIFMDRGTKLFDYLDDTAHFTDLVPKYKGLFYKKANQEIIKDLNENGTLFDSGKTVHRMPMCWRTETPLIYKPIKSWYVAVTKIKEKMISENNSVNWVPKHVGTGIAGAWIENARDWALSRSRYWGTPLPLWVNDKTGEMEFIGSYSELKDKSGVEVDDPHRPFVDEITWEDKENGGTFRRSPDVIDVWYDSGSMPFAQLHYPFDGKEKLKQKFPAEYVCEMTEQARLWFYTMIVLGVALFDKVPYKNVVAHGVMLDKEGKKLSKSKNNYPPMDDVLDKFGGDVLRFFILTSPVVQAESARFYSDALNEIRKEFFIPLWNSVKYFTTYANSNGFEPDGKIPASGNTLDKWILARFQEAVNISSDKMDDYLIMEAARQLKPFVVDLSTWYIRRSRDRISSGDKDAIQTLYYVLSGFTKLIAPMVPFISEKLYEVLGLRDISGLDSVHLDLYPREKELTREQRELLESMQSTRDIVSKALSIRVTEGIPVRQALGRVIVSKKVQFEGLVMEELNVKKVVVGKLEGKALVKDISGTVALDTDITEDLRLEGVARDMVRKIQDLRKKQKLDISDVVNVIFKSTDDTEEAVNKHRKLIKKKVLAQKLTSGGEYKVELVKK